MSEVSLYYTVSVIVTILLVIIIYGQVFRIRILEEQCGKEDAMKKLLIEQVSSLAQQLATIRVNHPGAAPDEIRFEEKVPPPKPYSQKLHDFLNGIVYSDARALVEEDIERFRNQGIDDEQVHELISQGDF